MDARHFSTQLFALFSIAALPMLTALPIDAQSNPASPAAAPATPTQTPVLVRGEIVDPVACTNFPGQSYALYLPSDYAPDRSWPVIYVYDPREHGGYAAELHRAAAERLGWIVVASNNTRSDERDHDPNPAAMQATWEDSHRRFAIDPRRVYATGFSGGARAAALLGITLDKRAKATPGATEKVAGVIGQGGGFPVGQRGPRPEAPPAFAFYGLAGRRDFNVSEMTQLEADLRAFGTPHHFESFDGRHTWAPVEEVGAAMVWMELRAALEPDLSSPAASRRPATADFVGALLGELRARAERARSENELLDAVRRFEMLDREFSRLLDPPAIAAIRAAAAEIRSSKEFVAQEREVREALVEERQRLAQAQRTLAEYLAAVGTLGIEGALGGTADGEIQQGARSALTGDARRAAARLELPRLQRDAVSHASRARRDAAARLLSTLSSQTGFYMPREYAARGDRQRERQLYELAVLIAPDNVRSWLGLAASRAATGRERDAMEALREAANQWDKSQAAERGPLDRAEVTSSTDFDSLRKRKDYLEWLASGGAKAAPTG